MDWVTILGLLLAGGGAGGLIKALSDYYKQRKEADSNSEGKTLEGCLKLFDEAKERITQLEGQMSTLQNKFIASITNQTEEGKENIKAVATLTEQLKSLKDKLAESESRQQEQAEIVEILREKLVAAEAEIVVLKKKLKEYEDNVN